jgi:hypothetical protein
MSGDRDGEKLINVSYLRDLGRCLFSVVRHTEDADDGVVGEGLVGFGVEEGGHGCWRRCIYKV